VRKSVSQIKSVGLHFGIVALGMALALSVGHWNHALGLDLSPREAAEVALKQSKEAKILDLNVRGLNYPTSLAKSALDWGVSLESYYEMSRFQNFQGTANPRDETIYSKMSLGKMFSSGTKFSFEGTRTSVQSLLASSGTASLFNSQPQQTMDVVGIVFEQNLWKNFFGKSTSGTILAAELTEKAGLVIRDNQKQDIVLEALRKFWTAFVSKQSFQDQVEARDRYEKLVNIVGRKNKLGQASPGEYAQVQAELELRRQAVKRESAQYLLNLDLLRNYLEISSDEEINFLVSEEIPELPEPEKIPMEELRPLRSQRLKVEAAEANLTAVEYGNKPEFNLVAKSYVMGIGNSGPDSIQDLLTGDRPKYYVGIKLSSTFGSETQEAAVAYAKIQRDLAQMNFLKSSMEQREKLSTVARTAQSTYSIAKSAERYKELRKLASVEIQKAYNQGRADIRSLIEALNQYFGAEVQYSQSVGNYQIALNEWAAARDELIPSKNMEQN
jgi:outer membrane protein TolC